MDEEELNKFIEEIANKYASGNLTTEENQAINNVGTFGRFGLTPQDISAGISGNQGNLDLRIPLDDPRRLNVSAATEVAGNIISANWTPMEKALFSLKLPLNQ
tara:strand:+ start:699 stop:1007 length:309 start_codon:yes stop_codon:yes gene_type:complete